MVGTTSGCGGMPHEISASKTYGCPQSGVFDFAVFSVRPIMLVQE